MTSSTDYLNVSRPVLLDYLNVATMSNETRREVEPLAVSTVPPSVITVDLAPFNKLVRNTSYTLVTQESPGPLPVYSRCPEHGFFDAFFDYAQNDTQPAAASSLLREAAGLAWSADMQPEFVGGVLGAGCGVWTKADWETGHVIFAVNTGRMCVGFRLPNLPLRRARSARPDELVRMLPAFRVLGRLVTASGALKDTHVFPSGYAQAVVAQFVAAWPLFCDTIHALVDQADQANETYPMYLVQHRLGLAAVGCALEDMPFGYRRGTADGLLYSPWLVYGWTMFEVHHWLSQTGLLVEGSDVNYRPVGSFPRSPDEVAEFTTWVKQRETLFSGLTDVEIVDWFDIDTDIHGYSGPRPESSYVPRLPTVQSLRGRGVRDATTFRLLLHNGLGPDLTDFGRRVVPGESPEKWQGLLPSYIDAWLELMPAESAAWAVAAGVTLDEAETKTRQTGTAWIDVSTFRLMAGFQNGSSATIYLREFLANH